MRRFASYSLFLTGFLLVILAVALLRTEVSYAQSDEAEYVGSRECSDCHKDVVRDHNATPHVLTLQDVQRKKDPILADFSQGEAVRTVQFPDGSEPRPFTAEDIAFTVGSGRYVQRYLYKVANNEYRVFPAEWNVQTQTWQPFTLANSWDDPAYNWSTNCAYCHTTGLNIQRGRWEDNGVQCEACHGPGSVHAELADDAGKNPDEDELVELRAAIYVGADPQICGQCHSQGRSESAEYPFPAGFLPGMNLQNSRVFTLVAQDNPVHWWATGHARQPNMQYNEWFNSAHARSLQGIKDNVPDASPACLTCHSSDYVYIETLRARVENGEREGVAPASLTLQTAQWGVTCISCHDVHLENTGHNSYVVADTYTLCVNCHTDTDVSNGVHHAMQQVYEGYTLIDNIPGIASSHFTTVNGPNCVTCHMAVVPVAAAARSSHSLKPVFPGDTLSVQEVQDSCTPCHAEQVNASQMQQLIDDIQNDTRFRLERARAAVNAATPAWVILALDLVEGDGSLGIHNYTYTDHLLDAVEVELGIAVVAEGQS